MPPNPKTRGFSLVELLVVLAVLVVIVGLSWPALQKPWHKSRLQNAAKQLQSELGRARIEAIESGRVLRLHCQPDTGQFVVRSGMEVEEPPAEQLPDGVFFRRIGAESKPITFYPNGRVTGGRFRLAGRHGYRIDVTLRGLTGTAKIGKVLRIEQPSDKSGEPRQ